VLLICKFKEALDCLIFNRRRCSILPDNDYVSAWPTCTSHVRGSDVLRKYAVACEAEAQDTLRSIVSSWKNFATNCLVRFIVIQRLSLVMFLICVTLSTNIRYLFTCLKGHQMHLRITDALFVMKAACKQNEHIMAPRVVTYWSALQPRKTVRLVVSKKSIQLTYVLRSLCSRGTLKMHQRQLLMDA